MEHMPHCIHLGMTPSTSIKQSLLLSGLLLSLTGCFDAQLSWESSASTTVTDEEESAAGNSSPSVHITFPTSGHVFNGSYSYATFAVSGTCSREGETVTLNSTVSGLHGLSAPCVSGAWSMSRDLSTGWSDGAHTIEAILGTDTHSVSVSKDTTVSSAGVSSGPAGALVYSGNITSVPFVWTCPEAGTLSFSASVASPGTGGPITGSIACATGGSQSENLNLTGLSGDAVSLTLTLNFTDAAGNVASPSPWVGSLDTIAVGPPSFSSMTNEGLAAGIDRYTTFAFVNILGTSPAGTLTVELHSNSTCNALLGSGSAASFVTPGISIATSNNAAVLVYARSLDAAGNPSTCVNLAQVIHDTLPPAVGSMNPSNIAITGTTTQSPVVSWSVATDSGSGILRYEIALGTTSGSSNVVAWTSVGAGTSYQFTGLSLTNGSTYFASVRAVDRLNNFSGAVSSNSFTVVLPPATPTLAIFPETHQSLTLQWSDVSGETHYELERDTTGSFTSPTPFSASANSTATTSSGLVFRTLYYYRIRAVNAGGASAWSTPVSARPLLNLQVPIELVDVGLSSSSTSALTFERTRTSLSPTQYDGQVEYYFEIVGTNDHTSLSYSVELVDSAGSVIPSGSILIPPSTTLQTRLRSSALTIPMADQQLRVRLPMTGANGNVTVTAARVIVRQRGANRTKLFIPLSVSRGSAVAVDSGFGANVVNTTSTAYNYAAPADVGAAIFRKRPLDYPQLAATNPWTFETVISVCGGAGLAYAALTQLGGSTTVTGTEVSTTTVPAALRTVSFPDTAPSFSANLDFEARVRATSGATACIFRANLWVTLENLETVWVPYRGGRVRPSVSATVSAALDGARQLYEGSQFSQPEAQFELAGRWEAGGTAGGGDLLDCGSNDSEPNSCSIPVSGSSYNFPWGNWGTYRSPAVALTEGSRWSPRFVNTNPSVTTFRNSFLWIRATGW
jgi:hypothetical protein